MTVRTRFAPAPSGELHVGNAHTALFAWLFARHNAGTFILRVEDTDKDRARPEVVDPVLDSLEWLGLDWDEGPRRGGPHGPYVTSERAEQHREIVAKLESSGAAYRCRCSREDIKARGRESGYDRFCRTRPDTPDGPYALRLAVPEGEGVEFDDVILGTVRRDYDELMDPVVVRTDGSPLYALAVTADDIAMEITDVIRGNDLLDSTFVQILLYRALGAHVPTFAHKPYVLGPDRTALSKRHGSQSLHELRAEGFLPEALLNYMALLGWSSPSGDELLTKERLVEEFTIGRVSAANVVFDHGKLRWMNQEYIKALSPDDLERRVLHEFPHTPAATLRLAVSTPDFVTPRVETLADIPPAIGYLHERPDVPADKLGPEATRVLPAAAEAIESAQPWTVEAIRERLEAACEALGLNRRKGLAPIRVAISGSTVSLPLYESIFIVGREESLARLRAVDVSRA